MYYSHNYDPSTGLFFEYNKSKDPGYAQYKDLSNRERLRTEAFKLIVQAKGDPREYGRLWEQSNLPKSWQFHIHQLIARDLMDQNRIRYTSKGQYEVIE